MALSKLVIGLVAGIASVATIGGVTAAVVTSNNRNTVSSVNEAESKEKENASMSENRNRANVQNDQQTSSFSDGDSKNDHEENRLMQPNKSSSSKQVTDSSSLAADSIKVSQMQAESGKEDEVQKTPSSTIEPTIEKGPISQDDSPKKEEPRQDIQTQEVAGSKPLSEDGNQAKEMNEMLNPKSDEKPGEAQTPSLKTLPQQAEGQLHQENPSGTSDS